MPNKHLVLDVLRTKTPAVVPATVSVREAVRRMTDHAGSAVLVMDGPHLLGLFTEHDLVWRVGAAGKTMDATRVGDVMSAAPMRRLAANTRLTEALAIMERGHHDHLPVVDNGTVIGLVSIGDLFAAVTAALKEERRQLDDYFFGSGYSVQDPIAERSGMA